MFIWGGTMPAHCCLLGGGTPEAVTNALLNPAATVRIWAAPNRIVVHVHDNGPGPPDPLAGLIPPRQRCRRRGTWAMAHPPARHRRALIYGDDGFTVRLRGSTITG